MPPVRPNLARLSIEANEGLGPAAELWEPLGHLVALESLDVGYCGARPPPLCSGPLPFPQASFHSRGRRASGTLAIPYGGTRL